MIGLYRLFTIKSLLYLRDSIGEELEMACARHEWIKLPEGPRCTVTWIGKEFFSGFQTFPIHMVEYRTTHHHLSSHLHTWCTTQCLDILREILYLECCQRHILSLHTTSTSDCLYHTTILVDDSEPESIVFWLDIIWEDIWGIILEDIAHALLEVSYLIYAIRVIQ